MTSRTPHVSDQLEAFVDGDLDSQAHASVQAHVAECHGCRAELNAAEAIKADLRSMTLHDAPPELLEQLKAIPARHLVRGSAPRQQRWSTALAAAAVLGLLAIGISTLRAPTAPLAPTAQEIEKAEQEARYAIALIAQFTKEAGDKTRHEIDARRLLEPATKRVINSLGRIQQSPIQRGTTPPENG